MLSLDAQRQPFVLAGGFPGLLSVHAPVASALTD